MSALTTVETVAAVRRRRVRRHRTVLTVLAVLGLGVLAASLIYGHTIYSPGEVLRVIFGEQVPGASFTVGRLRLPRAVLAIVAGACFGLGGVTFQTMLRNPLASPDIIGISAGASAAAAFAIIVLQLDGTPVSLFAIGFGLGVAALIYLLAYRNGVAGMRLILIGIGIAAMLESITSYLLERASTWDVQETLRWLTGSLNGANWGAIWPTLVALIVLGPILLSQSRNLAMLPLGDDAASALGVRTERVRLIVVVCAVGLIAFGTAAAGPIAFVAFLSGPIASRLVRSGASLLIPAAVVGALLVLIADFVGQYALGMRYPVGVVTGALGAPYLIFLIIRTNRVGGL